VTDLRESGSHSLANGVKYWLLPVHSSVSCGGSFQGSPCLYTSVP
jgi:hypothetical protein